MDSVTSEILHILGSVIKGKDDVITTAAAAIYAGGHILIEDIPGTGKTTLALGFAKAFGLDFRRIQLTPDTMASDITGYCAYDSTKGQLEFHQGAAFTNLLLADELNRTSGRTQSALLEAMEEGSCTVDSVTYRLPQPFNVIATQNPIGSAGTNEIPFSQLDRFMVRLKMGNPDRDSLKRILQDRHHENPLEKVECICSKENLTKIKAKCENVFVSERIYEYVCDIFEKTHQSERIAVGLSPRGALSLVKIAKANAFIEGRDYVNGADIRRFVGAVCGHRIVPSYGGAVGENAADAILSEIMREIPLPESERKG